ncbi:hypothetical protein [Aestuariivirga sp.]|uniref:hypothetical protein n=1 Tax=Aestuariivirga sp. TaxID=2650926 RepID=UPI0037836A77
MNRRRAQPPVSQTPEARSLKIVLPEGLSPEQRQRDAAEYLADMILELRNLARSVNLHTIMVPLEYAYYEAFGAAHRIEVPEGEIERIKRLVRVGEESNHRSG